MALSSEPDARKLAAMLKKIADTFGADDPNEDGADCPHDDDHGRTCSPDEPGGCVVCESRQLLTSLGFES